MLAFALVYIQARNSNHHEGSSLLTIQEGKWDKIKHWSGKQTLHCVFLDSTFSPFFNYLVQFCPQIERKLFTYIHTYMLVLFLSFPQGAIHLLNRALYYTAMVLVLVIDGGPHNAAILILIPVRVHIPISLCLMPD